MIREQLLLNDFLIAFVNYMYQTKAIKLLNKPGPAQVGAISKAQK